MPDIIIVEEKKEEEKLSDSMPRHFPEEMAKAKIIILGLKANIYNILGILS